MGATRRKALASPTVPADYNTVAHAADAALALAEAAVEDGWTIPPDRNRAVGPSKTTEPPRARLREVFSILNPTGMNLAEFDGMAWLLRRPAADDNARWRLSAALMVAGIGWVARLWGAENLCAGPQEVFSDFGTAKIPLGLLRVVAEGAAGVKARDRPPAEDWSAADADLPAWCARPKPLPLNRVTPPVQEVVRAAADILRNINETRAAPGTSNVRADYELFQHLDRLDWHHRHVPEPWPWEDPCMGEVEWVADGWPAATSAHAGAHDLGIRVWMPPCNPSGF